MSHTDPASAARRVAARFEAAKRAGHTDVALRVSEVVALLPVLNAVAAGRDASTAAIFARWSRPDHIRLHVGEMTAQEMRSVRAVLKAVREEIETAIW